MSLPSVSEFATEVEKLLVPDLRVRKAAEDNLIQLFNSHAKDLLGLCAQCIVCQGVTDRQIYCALIVMWKCMHGPPFVMFKKRWLDASFEALRNAIKAGLFECLRSEDVSVRNQAARLLAYVQKCEKDVSTEVFDALNHMVTGGDSVLSQRLGGLQTYKEVIEMKIYDSKEIPQEWQEMAKVIVDRIGTEGTGLEGVQICCEVLRAFIKQYKAVYYGLDRVGYVLQAIERRLPMANGKICEILYDIMLDLVFEFYREAETFMEKIYHITMEIGVQLGYGIQSLSFWNRLVKQERDRVRRGRGESKGYSKTAAKALVPLCLHVMSRMTGIDYSHEIAWSSCPSAAATRLLHTLIDVSQAECWDMVSKFVEQKMAQEDDSGNFLALSGIFGLIRGYAVSEAHQFVARMYPFVCRMTKSPNLSICHLAFRCIRDVYASESREFYGSPLYIGQTFQAIAESAARPDKTEGILETELSVLELMSTNLSIGIIQAQVRDFIRLFEILIAEPTVKKSPLIKEPYKIIGNIFVRLPCTDENRRPLLAYLNTLLSQGRQVFDQFQDDVTYACERQAGYLWLVGDLVKALKAASKPAMQTILEMCLTILSTSSMAEVHTEALETIVFLYKYCPISTECREADVLNVVEVCIKQGSPEIIGKVSYLLCQFFMERKESACQYLEKPLRVLIGLLCADGVDPRRRSYCEVVYAIGRICESMGSYFPEPAANTYLTKLCELVNVPIDKESNTEREQAAFLYEVIATGLVVFIKHFEAMGNKDAMKKLQDPVFTLAKKVDFVQTFTPMTLIALFEMLTLFGQATTKPRDANVKLNNIHIKNIIAKVATIRHKDDRLWKKVEDFRNLMKKI